jgi:hypothetical protein
MEAKHLFNKYKVYLIAIFLLFIVATIEYDTLFATGLTLKISVFCLSMIFPMSLSANLATFTLSMPKASKKIIMPLDISAYLFIIAQLVLWIMGLYQLQLYILSISIVLFIVTLVIFLFIRSSA